MNEETKAGKRRQNTKETKEQTARKDTRTQERDQNHTEMRRKGQRKGTRIQQEDLKSADLDEGEVLRTQVRYQHVLKWDVAAGDKSHAS